MTRRTETLAVMSAP